MFFLSPLRSWRYIWVGVVIVVGFVVSAGPSAFADDDSVVVNGSGQDLRFVGRGREFLVSGDGNRVVITGIAESVVVSGHNNYVKVDMVSDIVVSGFKNRVEYRGGDPDIVRGGRKCVVVQVGPRGGLGDEELSDDGDEATGNIVVIDGVSNHATYRGQGRSFEVNGTGNNIKLTGRVDRLEVSGTNNVVTVDKPRSIEVSGMGNRVYYRFGQPYVERSGLNNEVTKL